MPLNFRTILGLTGIFVAVLILRSRADEPEIGRPIMRAFSATEIQTRGPVLAFAECHDGSFLIGSNSLCAFDGRRWQRLDIPGAYRFRALEAASRVSQRDEGKERVWVGATGALGYVERNGSGLWEYVSLAPALRAANVTSSIDIAFVLSLGNGALFVSHHELFRWDGSRFETWSLPAPSPLIPFAEENGELRVYQEGVGILSVASAVAPRLVRPASMLPSNPPRWILPDIDPSASRDSLNRLTKREARPSKKGLLICTDDGVFRLTETSFEPLPALSKALAGKRSLQAIPIGEESLAVSTAKHGVFIATRDDVVKENLSRSNGLGDETVYAIWRNPRELLWIGLGNGCIVVDGIGSASIFDARDGLDHGLPRRVLAYDKHTYVLTDHSLYRLEIPVAAPTTLSTIDLPGTSFNDAITLDDSLWIAGSNGLTQLRNNESPESHFSGREVAALKAPRGAQDSFFYTRDKELLTQRIPFSQENLGPSASVALDESATSLAVDQAGDIWASTKSRQIYHFTRAPDPVIAGLVKVAQYNSSAGLPFTSPPLLFTLGAKLFAFTKSQIYVFQSSKGFIPAPEFSGWISVAASSPSQLDENNRPTAYWATQRLDLFDSAAPWVIFRVVISENGEILWDPLQVPGLDAVGDITSLDLVKTPSGEEILWIGGNSGLVRFRTSEARLAGTPVGLELREVRVDGRGSLELQSKKIGQIGPGASRIEFSFSSAKTTGVAAVFYQTQLQGVESEWSAPQRENTREFTGLAPGSYVFKARRVDRYGRTSPVAEYAFVVIAPWYERWHAFIGYAILLTLAIGGLLRWRLRILRLQTERLDRLVAHRTRELELSNTAKSEFLENISHEIRNPLNGIVGLVNLLKPEGLTTDDRQIAKSLKASAEHLRRVSEDVLGFSKLEFGYITIEEIPFSLGGVIREVVELYQEPARLQGNQIVFEEAANFAEDGFLGDASKIATILGNFVSNAVKYAPSTPIEIRADSTQDGGSTQIFISVIDHGPGVPVEEQELIFQKFVRGSNVKKNGVAGSGIGLATCRTLARRMGGAVGIESNVLSDQSKTSGTTFYLWLPLKRAAQENLDIASPILSSPGLPAPNQNQKTALIVDDEEYNRIVLAGLMKELGYQTQVASDAASAEMAMRRHVAEVVLLDLELVGGKGNDTARVLRKLPGGEKPVVIATTGHDSDESRQRCRDSGMDGFLLKPFDGKQTLEVIQRVLAERASGKINSFVTFPSSPKASLDAGIEHKTSMRAFQLYAKGTGDSIDTAAQRFIMALDHELDAIREGSDRDDRSILSASGHRLRTLGALVHATRVNGAAIRLQEKAMSLHRTLLDELVKEVVSETEKLKSEIQGRHPT